MKKKINVKKIIIEYDEPVYGMSVVCRLIKIPEWTLRMLDKNKIVIPHKSQGKTRLYSHKDLDRLQYIHDIMEEKNLDIRDLKVLMKFSNLFD
ncbi:MAG: MerR family transcriptional regulator [Endomicrobiaceae bacterium]|jgi:MerR family transcriptional regulator/heat shock protein HspR|nr:MerR family transcriptional regulator [Endomicrobiaceae bacterium]MDD4166893.1 MerR family transcriptional regulator [Endomicrobiaceae bacterium]